MLFVYLIYRPESTGSRVKCVENMAHLYSRRDKKATIIMKKQGGA